MEREAAAGVAHAAHRLAELAEDLRHLGAAAAEVLQPSVLEALATSPGPGYAWPGNVRELKNAIERAVLLGQQGEITTGFLQLGRRQQQHGGFHLQQENGTMSVSIPESGISLEAVEKALLQKSMEMAAGNKAKAARLLHLSRETLRYRLRKFNLD